MTNQLSIESDDLPLGFQFAGVSSGIKKAAGKLDLSLFVSDRSAVGAGVYTQNLVRAASVIRNESITPSGSVRAVAINSGNANACTGTQGDSDNQQFASNVAQAIGCAADEVLILSTGIIGEFLPMEKIEQGVRAAASTLEHSTQGFANAARGILTTDQGPKVARLNKAVAASDGSSSSIRLLGAAKGAGMIGPNMATMLSVVVTDARLTEHDAQMALKFAVDQSFNRISVDGHTSTNDAVLLLASGEALSEPLAGDSLEQFQESLTSLCIELAKQIPADGEGASHLVTIRVTGCESEEDADRIARTIALSALVKTAIAGNDPNWGRIVSAAGYAGVELRPEKLSLKVNGTEIFSAGEPTKFDAEVLSKRLADSFDTYLELDLGLGEAEVTHWTSDLNEAYVKLNSDYHT